MKKRIPLIILFIPLTLYAQSSEIQLPEITTYVSSSIEQKIVLTAETLEAEHLETLADVVERCGIQNLSYGAYGLENKPSIRGFTDETVRVVIDGICVNNAQYGTFDFSTIDISAIEKIEIVRGGFTEGVEDEGSVGGAIYITTKKAVLENTLSAEASVKTFFNSEAPLDSIFQKLTFAGRTGQNTFINGGISGNFAENKYKFKADKTGHINEGIFGGFFDDSTGLTGSWRTRENSQVLDGLGNASLTHYFGGGNYFSLSDLVYAGYKQTPGAAFGSGQGLQQDYNNNLAFTVWNPALAGLFNLKNSLVWLCNNRFYQENSDKSEHYINTVKYTGSADFYSLWGGRLKQSLGISSDYTNLNSTNDGNHNQFSGVVKETTKLVFGRLGPGTLSASLPMAAKFCANDDNVNFAFVPKAGLSWDLPYVQLICDFYRMVQFPNMDDLFWVGGGFYGNPNLKPESGWGGDLGANLRELSFGHGDCTTLLHGSLTLFSNYYKDKIQWSSNTTQNLSSAFYLGLDFSAGASFLNGFIDLDLNGEYLYNRLLDKSNKYTYGKRIMWTPDFVCSASAAFNFELAKIHVSAQYMGRRYTSNMNIYYLKPYLLVNLAAEGVPVNGAIGKGKFMPFLKIDNLLNWSYQSVTGYPMPGISLTVGAKYKFF